VAGHFAAAVAFLMVAVGHFVVAAGMAAGMEEGDRRVPKTGKRNPYLIFAPTCRAALTKVMALGSALQS
jgi:hypothetical protein